MREDQSEVDKGDQDDSGPMSLIADENEQPTKQIDSRDQIGDHYRREDAARHARKFHNHRISGVGGDIRELQVSEDNEDNKDYRC